MVVRKFITKCPILTHETFSLVLAAQSEEKTETLSEVW